ncbi:dephospho-CoA kinase [Paraliobacillus salinarum]|uniref:dephospho-CoA kinase n=1 Tax=Paraliobacillus salinarum TaxID=1158996 RepID=UPI0015F3EDCA|nr:dephospho-CoA kinase [Paraliobacillus salinarum]
MSTIIGLTGGIATGKSTVSNLFKASRIPVIDADQIAKQVVEPGEEAYHQIINTFGSSVIQEDGQLNRRKLGNIVFSNEKKRQLLNNIVHPQVKNVMLNKRDRLIKENHPLIVLDIPLLFESQLEDLVDMIVVVYSRPETQLARLMKRNKLTKEEATDRIQSQISITQKAEKADVILDNNGSIDELEQQFTAFMNTLV